jgi:hypothetical protein
MKPPISRMVGPKLSSRFCHHGAVWSMGVALTTAPCCSSCVRSVGSEKVGWTVVNVVTWTVCVALGGV